MIELLITSFTKKFLLDAANFVASNEIARATTKGQHMYLTHIYFRGISKVEGRGQQAKRDTNAHTYYLFDCLSDLRIPII